MLVILLTASCVLMVTGQQQMMPRQQPMMPGQRMVAAAMPIINALVPGMNGRSLNLATLGVGPTLEGVCNAAVFQNNGVVSDSLSDTMGTAVAKMMQHPFYSISPLKMGGASQGWQCLIEANRGNTAGGIGDYFDTVPKLTKLIPGFDPCKTVFCGEKQLGDPVAIATKIFNSIHGGFQLAPALLNLFGAKASSVQSLINSRRSRSFFGGRRQGMGGMGSIGQVGSNPFLSALKGIAGSGGFGGMGASGGMGTSGGMGGSTGLASMMQQLLGGMKLSPSQPQPLNTGAPAGVSSAANTNLAQTNAPGATNSATNQPAAPSANPFSVAAVNNPSPVNPSPSVPRQSNNPMGTMSSQATINKMAQQIQQLKTQLQAVRMGQNKPSPGTGMGLPGMGMPNMGISSMGLPGMGGINNAFNAMLMGKTMADMDPVRAGMGVGTPGMSRGMPAMGGMSGLASMFGSLFSPASASRPSMGPTFPGTSGTGGSGGAGGFPLGMNFGLF